MPVCIVIVDRRKFKFDAMSVNLLFVKRVTGVMNFKRIMRFGFVIGVMPFIAVGVMKWINAMIVEKLYVLVAQPCSVASFVVEDYVKNVLPLVDGTCLRSCESMLEYDMDACFQLPSRCD